MQCTKNHRIKEGKMLIIVRRRGKFQIIRAGSCHQGKLVNQVPK